MVDGAAQLENPRQPAPGYTRTIAIKFNRAARRTVLRRHPAPCPAGLSSGWNSFAAPATGARRAGARRSSIAPDGRADALPLRRAVHLPHRPQGKRLRAALRRSVLKGERDDLRTAVYKCIPGACRRCSTVSPTSRSDLGGWHQAAASGPPWWESSQSSTICWPESLADREKKWNAFVSSNGSPSAPEREEAGAIANVSNQPWRRRRFVGK